MDSNSIDRVASPMKEKANIRISEDEIPLEQKKAEARIM
jgi:hypothetical protein